jgi:hypothetical protein
MEMLVAFVALVLGLLVRIVLPVGVTVLMIYFLKRMDESWQASSTTPSNMARARNAGCWEINKCPPEQRARCNAHAHPDIPCWQYYRQENNGLLPERCLACKVFRGAPIPVS